MTDNVRLWVFFIEVRRKSRELLLKTTFLKDFYKAFSIQMRSDFKMAPAMHESKTTLI